jgi:anti-sigma regulatory factor (Ser/Thr protein kinase)
VTNSYQHAGNPEGVPIDVTVDLEGDRLRVEVIDRSIFDPTPETEGELRAGRLGLWIMDQLAASWGRVSEGGVWAEFHTSGS